MENTIFQHDNEPARRSEHISNWRQNAGFKDERVMIWPFNSPDLKPIKNVWVIIKTLVYCKGRQFKNLTDLWKTVQEVSASRTPSEI